MRSAAAEYRNKRFRAWLARNSSGRRREMPAGGEEASLRRNHRRAVERRAGR